MSIQLCISDLEHVIKFITSNADSSSLFLCVYHKILIHINVFTIYLYFKEIKALLFLDTVKILHYLKITVIKLRNVKYAFRFLKGTLQFSICFENNSSSHSILEVTLLITSANYL